MLPSGAAASEWSEDGVPRCQVLLTTSDAHDIAFGDLNDDGLEDIALASDDGVELFLQTVDGTFSDASTTIDLPYMLVDLECADVDGDSMDDLVMLFSDDDSVIWSSQAESFAWNASNRLAITNLGTNDALVVEDLDEDGAMDMVVGISFSSQAAIRTYSNFTGAVVENGAENVPYVDGVSDMVLGDIDGDGSSDLIIAGASMNLTVMLNGGAGVMDPIDWSVADTVPVYGPSSLSTVNWNASDPIDHVSFIGRDGPTQQERLSVYHLNGTMQLTTSTGFLDDVAWPCAVTSDDSPIAYLCTPDGTMMRSVTDDGLLGGLEQVSPCHGDVVSIVTHDLDGDGDGDLLMLSPGSLTVMWGPEPTNADSNVFDLPSWQLVTMGDLNGSVAIVTVDGPMVTVTDANGTVAGTMTCTDDVVDIGLHDVDGDGDGDLVCLDVDGYVHRASTAAGWDDSLASGVGNVTVLTFGDIDLDGVDDVIVGGSGIAWMDVDWIVGSGTGVVMSAIEVTSIAVGDLNSAYDPEGWSDLAFIENGTMGFLIRDSGSFSWTDFTVDDLTSSPIDVVADDVDGDGLDDCVALLEDGTLMTFPQLESDPYGIRASHRSAYVPNVGYDSLLIGDVDEDGVYEAFGVNATAGTVTIVSLVDDTVMGAMFAGEGTITATVADMDGDGRGDIVVAANASRCVSYDVGVNHAPVAVIDDPGAVTECVEVLLSAHGSTDDASDMGTLEYEWDVMGVVYHGPEVTVVFPDSGAQNVTLTITDRGGLQGNVTVTVTVSDLMPLANASVPTDMTEDVPMTFEDASTMDGDVVSWAWDLGDGTTSGERSPEHAYAEDGTYTVSLNVTDDEGNWDEASWTVFVADARLTASMDVGGDRLEGAALWFNDTSDSLPDAIVSTHWDMGDGTELDGTSVEHVYASNGTYVVRLTVVDDDGRAAWKNVTVVIDDVAPTVAIVGETSGLVDGDVLSLDASVVSWDQVSSIAWKVDDENVSTGQGLLWDVPENGTYVVVLTVVDSDGSVAMTDVTVMVDDRGLSADFTVPTLKEGEEATFEDASDSWPDEIVLWEWSVDGQVSNSADLTWTFDDSGDHAVSLMVMDDDGRYAWCNRTVHVEDSVPNAEISTDVTSVAEGDSITLTDSSSSHDPIASRVWEVDGSAYGDGMTIEVTLMTEGDHVIRLVLIDSDGSTSDASVVIDVHDRMAVAAFDAPDDVVEGQTAVFKDASDSWPDTLTGWAWDFGDGSSGEGEAPTHVYAQDGTYIVNLTVTDSDGRVFWTMSVVTVNDTGPSASFSASAPSSSEYDELTFTDGTASHDGIARRTWTIGGIEVGNGSTLVHTFRENGTHLVSLTVWEADGDSDTYDIEHAVIDTSPTLSAIASSSGDGLHEGEWTTLSVTVQTFDPTVRFVWDTGDGVVETLTPSIERSWSEAGEYLVTVKAWDADSSSSAMATIVVSNVPPVAAFDVSSREGGLLLVDASETVDTAGDALAYWWNFGEGDGFTGPFDSPTTSHQYGSGGPYVVTLRAIDDDGRADESSIDVYVDMSPPALSDLRVVSGGVGSMPTTIAIEVGDDGAVAGVALSYRLNGTVEQVTMTLNGDGSWEAQIPRQAIGTELEYWVTAIDGSGNVASTGEVSLRVVDVDEGVPGWAWLALVIGVVALIAMLIVLLTPRVEEVFIIYSDGRMIAHESRRVRPMDQDIMSSMLVAIQDFVRESFRDEAETDLEGLRFGDNEAIIGRGDHIYVAAVGSKGHVAGIRDAVERLVDELEEDFEVDSWDGDMEAFRGMRERLGPLFRRTPMLRRSYNR